LQAGGSPGARRSRAVQARRGAAASERDGLDPLGLRVDDEVAVADRLVPDSKIEDAENTMPRLLDPRRLKRKVNSSR
jgi:hypothetical protein